MSNYCKLLLSACNFVVYCPEFNQTIHRFRQTIGSSTVQVLCSDPTTANNANVNVDMVLPGHECRVDCTRNGTGRPNTNLGFPQDKTNLWRCELDDDNFARFKNDNAPSDFAQCEEGPFVNQWIRHFLNGLYFCDAFTFLIRFRCFLFGFWPC